MYYLKSVIKHILLVVLCIIHSNSHADIEGIIKPYLWDKKLTLDSQLKLLYENEEIKTAATVIPIEIRPNICIWDAIPEYYVSIKDNSVGKITIGAHNANILMVDPGNFAVGNSDILSDGNSLYSQSLVNNLQPQGYRYKVSYLLKRENFYLSSAYLPLNNTIQARFLYINSLSAATDVKASVSIINDKIVSGFNVKYLGFIFGGSYSSNFYTAGIGYLIGPFKSSLTYLSQGKNTIFGVQYNLNKNIAPFIQVGNSDINSKNLSIGLRMSF